MGFLRDLFGGMPGNLGAGDKAEAQKLIDELIKIGKQDDYLSERPGGQFNMQCHHIRARAIGKTLNDLGGLALMEHARGRVRKAFGRQGASIAAHLDYAWMGIGDWTF